MENTTLLYKIIKGSTITVTKNITYIDRYKSNWETVNADFSQYLIYMEILKEVSGNFETGEVHYILNDELYFFRKFSLGDKCSKNVLIVIVKIFRIFFYCY